MRNRLFIGQLQAEHCSATGPRYASAIVIAPNIADAWHLQHAAVEVHSAGVGYAEQPPVEIPANRLDPHRA
jgi:hypothetical protein